MTLFQTKHQYRLENGQIIRLSQREYESLNFILTGLSAKAAAYSFKISFRTVEKYFATVRRKFECRSKLEVMHKFHSGMIVMHDAQD